MQYRTLGKTGLKVSALAYGGSSLGSVFHDIDESEGIRSVHVALDHGINFIDTAPFYGLTKAETVLGKALKEIRRDRFLLATKVARFGYKQENFDFSGARALSSIDESLRRLNIDHIDLIQVHDMEFGDLDQIVNETLPALRQAQKQGKVRFVGITGLPFKTLNHVLVRAEVDCIQSYCHYCLNDTALADHLPALQKLNVGIINSAPLAMRLLSNEGPPQWHPAPEALRAKCAEAAAHCRQRGADIAKLALQFSLANPAIHTNVVGTASPARILENLKQIADPLDETLLREVQTILRPVHNLTWPSGRPENN
jgi:L-galactose dehydrogenase